MPGCTWVDCTAAGDVEQVAKDGEVWARLCRSHHDELDAAVAGADPRGLMRAYVRAQGGAKAVAARMAPAGAQVAAAVVEAVKGAWR